MLFLMHTAGARLVMWIIKYFYSMIDQLKMLKKVDKFSQVLW